MKKIILLILMINVSILADWGFFELDRSWIGINFNGTSTWYSAWNGGTGTFQNANLGNFTLLTETLAIESWDIKTFKNGTSDVTGVNLWYRIYKQGSVAGSFSSAGGGFIENLPNPGDQKWGKTIPTSIDISFIEPGETYLFEFYIEAYGTNPTETKYDNNSGVNYIATFTTENLLPVELTSFTASKVGSSVKLNWKTATEINNYGFQVERASSSTTPLQVWEKIGFVNGNGNSNSPKNYSFVDNKVSAGKYSYRLKQIDNDGEFEYSKTIEVSFMKPTGFQLDQNYPNPFNPVTTIRFNLPESGNVKLTLFNLLGQELKTLVNDFRESGEHQVNVDASDLNSGVYVYKIESGSFTQTKKMTLIK